ncbi:MAG: hypothetical protein NTV49_08720 [Kiritimatiellaeota bacterium]|nr:hypothetical protein [Kiritimatiellota bacterium]
MKQSIRWLALTATLPLWLAAVRAEIPAAAAEQIARSNQHFVVTIRATLKMSVRVNGATAQEQGETPIECPATVVSTAGLVAASSMLLDPVGSMMPGPMRMERQGQIIEVQFVSRLEAVRLLLPDKTEVPAKIVMQDDDLRLTLLAPELGPGDKSAKYPAVALEHNAVPAPFSSFLLLGRTGASFQREPCLYSGVICAILAKPRTAFLPQVQPAVPFMGLPFFAADGRLLGIGSVTFRALSAAQLPPAMQNLSMLPVIVPAADVRDFVARAGKSTPRKPASAPHPPPAA